MILLDTNALLWMERAHPRSEPLLSYHGRLYVSPASLLEVQFLIEVGESSCGVAPASTIWHGTIAGLSTIHRRRRGSSRRATSHGPRDPFDRLIVAHAELRKLRLATGDSQILARLNDRQVLEL